MRLKKFLCLGAALVVSLGLLSGCGKSEETGSVYYLNFKPEVADIWQKIAETYTEETGVEVKILTAASGEYEKTLKAEIGKKDAPTLFQVNGPIGYSHWKNFCLDLKDTELYSWLLDPSMAIKDGDGIYGIPYVVEGYGIIYNEQIMNRYFALPTKTVDISSVSEINNYETLRAVVEDMTRNKKKLEIEGVFGSTSFAAGEDWRWQTHLANIPIYYEFRDKNISTTDQIDFKYEEQYRDIFDLYINNSGTSKNVLDKKVVTDSMTEFAMGEVAMIQNGNWAWGQISGIQGNVVGKDDIKFLPIYTGVEGEEKQGLCTGTENFMCVNANASEADQKASIAFMEWLFSSKKGKDFITNEFGFISPFNTFEETETPNDPLAKQVVAYMNNPNLTSVSWNFTAFPGQHFKNDLGASLLSYAKGEKKWEAVVEDMITSWKTEKEKE